MPFKRYDAEALESFATQGPTAAVAADTSTLVRWQTWLEVWMPDVQRCWAALAAQDRIAETDGAPPFPAALHGRALATDPFGVGDRTRPIYAEARPTSRRFCR